VTIGEELAFVWHWGRNLYVRILFLGARYSALACTILYWFLVTAEAANILTSLRITTAICSELIFATRAWVIWGRSRQILLFLIGLTVAFSALGATTAVLTASDVLVTPHFPLVLDGVGLYQITITATKSPWGIPIPILLVLVYQSVVLGLTLYRLLWCRRHIAKQEKSTLIDVLWIDGTMYYVFMFITGVLNTGLTLKFYNRAIPLSLAQLGTALQSILSTRVVLHTATVLRQEIVDSRATLAPNRASSTLRFAEVASLATGSSGTVPGDVELQETR